jgi:hypothetical protein
LHVVDRIWIYIIAVYRTYASLFRISMDYLHGRQHDYGDVVVDWRLGHSAYANKITFEEMSFFYSCYGASACE